MSTEMRKLMEAINVDSNNQFEEFFNSYIQAALWSSTYDKKELIRPHFGDLVSEPTHDDPMDADFDINDFDSASLSKMRQESAQFFDEAAPIIEKAIEEGVYPPIGIHYDTSGYAMAGHDFWLTRNGHGAGFWDGDWVSKTEDYGELLEIISKKFGEIDLYVANGKVYVY